MDARRYGRTGKPPGRLALLTVFPLLILMGCGQGDKPPEAAVGGSLDGVTGESIHGWAWDGNRPDSPVKVDIFDGATKLDTVLADAYREDLVAGRIGNGKHGFVYPTPAGLKDGKPHTIRVTISGTDKEVASPKTLTLTPDGAGGGVGSPPPDETIQSSLDGVNAEGISGWAWDRKRPDSPVKLDIFDGDTKLATLPAEQFRQDLAEAKIGDGKHGFSYPTPAGLKDGKPHTIRVKVAGTGMEIGGSPMTLKSP
jgi:hypothetical protein